MRTYADWPAIDPVVRVARLDLTSETTVEWSADRTGGGARRRPRHRPGLGARAVGRRPDRSPAGARRDRRGRQRPSATSSSARTGSATSVGTTHVSVASRDTAMVAPVGPGGIRTQCRPRRPPTDAFRRPASAPADRSDVVVREARPDDLDAVVAANVAVQAYDAHLGGLPDRPDSARGDPTGRREGAPRAARMDSRGRAGRCRRRRLPGGAARGRRVGRRVRSRARRRRTSPTLYVDPTSRGRQVGSRLVAAAHLRATAAGAQVVVLHHSAPTRSRRRSGRVPATGRSSPVGHVG